MSTVWDSLGLDSITQSALDAGSQALDASIVNAINSTPQGSYVDPVPTQNLILQTVLAPVSAALQNPAVTSNVSALNALGQFLSSQQAKWMQFANAHPSTRMTGAVNTLAPYWTNLGNAISRDVVALGGTPTTVPGIPGVTIPPTGTLANLFSGGTSSLLLVGVAAWFLLGRKG